ncbi:unnamed protein product, partial [marine sediment metagenome]
EFVDYDGDKLEEFCVNARTWLLLNARKKYKGSIFWMDATTLIRKNCCGLVGLMDGIDVLVHKKRGEMGSYLTGVLGLSENPAIMEFLKRWNKATQENNTWYANQNFLPAALFGLDKIKTNQLPATYIDWKFNDSVIWTGKGRAARCDKRWKKEMKRWKVKWEYEGTKPSKRYVKQNVRDEVGFWVKGGKKVKDRGKRIENLFNRYIKDDFAIVADVGCGPRCGIFERKRFPEMYAVDPLWKKYSKWGVAEKPKGVRIIVDSAEF